MPIRADRPRFTDHERGEGRVRTVLHGVFRRLLRQTLRHPAPTAGKVLTTVGVLWIAVNAAELQDRPHPAPYFAPPRGVQAEPAQPATVASLDPMAAAIDGVTAAPLPVSSAPAAAQSDVVTDIQQQLVGLGFFRGPVDGRLDPATKQAVRLFEATHGLAVDGKPSLGLLASLHAGAPVSRAVVELVQRALAARGYGPLAADGMMGQKTAAALARFEHDRGLPATGTITPGVLDKLGVLTKLSG